MHELLPQGPAQESSHPPAGQPLERPWQLGAAGVVQLPSGRRVRGRGLGYPLPAGLEPHRSLYLLQDVPAGASVGGWPCRWVAWPDFGLPVNPHALVEELGGLLAAAAAERVEVGCWGGRGRTGTALAVLAVLDGVPAQEAVGWVHECYDAAAVETVEQERFAVTVVGRR